MTDSVSFRNFRCYKQLQVDQLRRVNVVVGPNGTGKTAFLEGIFLASGGSPELAFRLQSFRGMATGQQTTTEALRTLWSDLFYRFHQEAPLEIWLRAKSRTERRLRVSLGKYEEVSLPLEEFERGAGLIVDVPIDFAWTNSRDETFVSRPKITDGRVTFPSARDVSRAVFLAAHHRQSTDEIARRLSNVTTRGELQALVDIIASVYTDIEDLSVQVNAGSWQPFVKLRGRQRLLPLALYSAGANKFVSMILAVTDAAGGAVLLDELENGFYFEMFGSIWRALLEVARSYGCQMFITTHSAECLRGLATVLETDEGDFSLLKTGMKGDQGTVYHSTGDVLSAALQSGFEIR